MKSYKNTFNQGRSMPVVALLFAILAVSSVCFGQATSLPFFLPDPVRKVSTMPPNGDLNPFGVAFVPANFPAGGILQPGDILVSNFNDVNNLEGTGTTVVRVPQNGVPPSVFYQSSSPYTGLSTALSVLRTGFVLVGSLPTLDGTAATARPGALLVVNSVGKLVTTISGSEIQGPWDMTVNDEGSKVQAFVANAMNGSITRLDLAVSRAGVSLVDSVEVASGYQHQSDPASLFDAPTGLVYDAASDTLYIASTLDNAVFAVTDAGHATSSQGTGSVVYQDAAHLHGALAMTQTPAGHLLVTNNDVINADPNQPSEIVEFTKQGQFVKELSLDPNLGGGFGVQVHTFGANVAQLAAVDDNALTLTIWTLPPH